MTTFTCPMHPEVKSNKAGRCPKCGMRLVKTGEHPQHEKEKKSTWHDYMPLVVVISMLCLTTLAITLKDIQIGTPSLSKAVSYFMIGFFLVFSGFKLIDLKGFAQGYSTYDLLAKKWFYYGYIYPFIELFFAFSMILLPFSHVLLISEIIIMAFSGVGVAIKLAKKEQFQCACLGTFLKVPLTKITLIEDFGMALLGALLLLIS